MEMMKKAALVTVAFFMAAAVGAVAGNGLNNGSTTLTSDASSVILAGKGHGHGHGPGDGTGNGGDGPADGAGNGPGDCSEVSGIDTAAFVLAGNGHGPGDGTGTGDQGKGTGDCKA